MTNNCAVAAGDAARNISALITVFFQPVSVRQPAGPAAFCHYIHKGKYTQLFAILEGAGLVQPTHSQPCASAEAAR